MCVLPYRWCSLTVIGHGEDGDLSDGAIAAFHTASSLHGDACVCVRVCVCVCVCVCVYVVETQTITIQPPHEHNMRSVITHR